MRKVTREIVDAFYSGVRKTIANTRTDGRAIFLHNNKIAEMREGELWITAAGWKTRTTKERLNGLRGVGISTRRGVWYLNDTEWDGEWICTSNPQQNWLNIFNDEVEFDITSEWMEEGYSRPLYSVFHSLNVHDLEAIEERLDDALIQSRRMESDTAGEYKPHHFIIVKADDLERAVKVIG